MPKLKIAVVQFEIKQFAPEENLAKAEKYIRKAADAGADIIVFPEDFTVGPLFGRKEFVDFDGKYRQYFQQLAREHNINIVTGSFAEGDKLGWYNTTYYIESKGEIKGRYRKVNLWLPERRELSYGNELCVFNTKFGKIGLIICWDLIFPEMFRRMVVRGVNIVICTSYWGMKDAPIGLKWSKDAEIKTVNSLCSSRAFENEIVLVYCNAAGKYQYKGIDYPLMGQSQICVPFIGAIKRLDHNKEEMFVAEVDTAVLKDAERAYRIRSDLKKRIL
ncbi:MAG: carbon-nitrogen hydrolase family protein [Candidatus Aenigmarchaeota archaeon]|nr:carbon-nitrogen hydrolase family protein [Candidatus Aenigmarchaeota archaeon]